MFSLHYLSVFEKTGELVFGLYLPLIIGTVVAQLFIYQSLLF